MIAEVEQTIHPLATHSLAELQDIANKGEILYRKDWTRFEWECLVDLTLTIKEKPRLDNISDAKNFESTAEI